MVEVDDMPKHIRDIRLWRAVPIDKGSERQLVVDEVVEPLRVDAAYDCHYTDVPSVRKSASCAGQQRSRDAKVTAGQEIPELVW